MRDADFSSQAGDNVAEDQGIKVFATFEEA